MLTTISSQDVGHAASAIVGFVFFGTGLLKAVNPRTFRRHLTLTGILPVNWIEAATTSVAAFEAGWGLMLVVSLAPSISLPASMGMLIGLSAFSWWSVRSGRTEDCGCYGGFAQPSIRESLALNAFFLLLLLAAWNALRFDVSIPLWKLFAIGSGLLMVGLLAHASQRSERINGHPLIDTNPIKPGKKWEASWAAKHPIGEGGRETLVSFLGPDCPHCKTWVKIANAISQSASLPAVVGVVSARPEKVSIFKEENRVRFPVVTVSDSLMSRLAPAVPTTILVAEGRIVQVWAGAIPPDFIQRFQSAFFPEAFKAASGSASRPSG